MTQSTPVHYAGEPDLDVAEFNRVLLESGLGMTRPTGDLPRIQQMLAEADLIVTARRRSRRVRHAGFSAAQSAARRVPAGGRLTESGWPMRWRR
jgi:hypothetical protein